MNKYTEDDISRLTLNEISLLNRILNAPKRQLQVDNVSLGGLVGQLSKKGLVKPAGKVNGNFIWEVDLDRIEHEAFPTLRRLGEVEIPV